MSTAAAIMRFSMELSSSSNFADQRLYLQELGSEPRPLTPAGGATLRRRRKSPATEICFSVCAKTIPPKARSINTSREHRVNGEDAINEL